ncbi:hypothetical protein ACG04R_00935 [Roseateles sp. BYS78W]|uniref:Uncharacterized protein n=1 Tax=Pelomonas candidula TaxID=3299025 RepID=A0ABW7H5P1_9BURK
MSRFLIQSGLTFQFITVLPSGDVGWTPSLLTALRHGVIDEADQVAQLVEDYCDRGTALVVDLDAEA